MQGWSRHNEAVEETFRDLCQAVSSGDSYALSIGAHVAAQNDAPSIEGTRILGCRMPLFDETRSRSPHHRDSVSRRHRRRSGFTEAGRVKVEQNQRVQTSGTIPENRLERRCGDVFTMWVDESGLASEAVRLQTDSPGHEGRHRDAVHDVTVETRFQSSQLQVDVSRRLQRVADYEKGDRLPRRQRQQFVRCLDRRSHPTAPTTDDRVQPLLLGRRQHRGVPLQESMRAGSRGSDSLDAHHIEVAGTESYQPEASPIIGHLGTHLGRAVIVKRVRMLAPSRVMRHLSVPRSETERWRLALRDASLLRLDASVIGQGDHRLIPLSDSAPDPLPSPFDAFEVVRREASIRVVQLDWREHLRHRVGDAIYSEHLDAWPSAHEQMGDLIIIRLLDHSVEGFAADIACGLLMSMPRMRLAVRDDGVVGDFRVRRLTPLAVRDERGVRPVEGEGHSTRTVIREHGASVIVDPGRAYFSTKLSGERGSTVEAALRLRSRLGRPLSVCDPYCGVGPALVHLLRTPGLVSSLLASDLNPKAMPLLRENLESCGVDASDLTADAVIRPASVEQHPDQNAGHRPEGPVVRLLAGVVDARQLADSPALCGVWDLLLVNLPHDALRHLPLLLPLLRRDGPAMIRGWTILDDDEIAGVGSQLAEMLPRLDVEMMRGELIESRKSYSSNRSLCRFEAWLAAE